MIFDNVCDQFMQFMKSKSKIEIERREREEAGESKDEGGRAG